MRKMGFLKFLISCLAIIAFFAGYALVKDNSNQPNLKTGTILDKFDNQGQTADNQESSKDDHIPFLVSGRRVVSLTSSSDKGNIVYFEKNTGKLLESNLKDRSESVLSETILPNFLRTIWSSNKKEVVSVFYNKDRETFKYHSYSSHRTVDLKNPESVAFSPDGNLIVYYSSPVAASQSGSDLSIEQTGKIAISQTDGTYSKNILETRLNNLEVLWPAKNQISLKTPNNELFLLTEDGGLTKFIESKPNLRFKWSKSGKSLIFSALTGADTQESFMFIKDAETRGETPLNMPGDASKCDWSIDDANVFCALKKSPSVDEIYKINLSTGSRGLIAEPGFLVKEVVVSGLEDYILFISAVDDKLYGVKVSD